MININSKGEVEYVYRVTLQDGEFIKAVKPEVVKKEIRGISGEYEWILREFKKRRTNAQNDTQWWYFTEIAKKTGHTKQYIHSILSFKFLLTEEVDEKTGEVFPRVKGTSELDTEEHNVFMENVRNWAKLYLNMELPLPDANWNFNFDE